MTRTLQDPPVVTEWSGSYAMRGTSVREARARARLLAAAWQWGGEVEDAVLVVSELATNAVRHAARPGRVLALRLALLEDGALLVDVSDPVAGLGPAAEAGTAEYGRGLELVRALACGVEWILRPDAGKTARVRVPGRETPRGASAVEEQQR